MGVMLISQHFFPSVLSLFRAMSCFICVYVSIHVLPFLLVCDYTDLEIYMLLIAERDAFSCPKPPLRLRVSIESTCNLLCC